MRLGVLLTGSITSLIKTFPWRAANDHLCPAFQRAQVFAYKVKNVAWTKLSLERLHVCEKFLRLVRSNSFCFIARHIRWLLGLLTFQNGLNGFIFGPGGVPFLFRLGAVAG